MFFQKKKKSRGKERNKYIFPRVHHCCRGAEGRPSRHPRWRLPSPQPAGRGRAARPERPSPVLQEIKVCARQPAARGGWGRTCQRRMCVLFALILGTARGAPQRGERGVPGVVFPKRRGVLGRPVSVRAGHLPPPPRTGGGQRHGPLPCALLPITAGQTPGGGLQARWQAAPFRQGLGGHRYVPSDPACHPHL